ncbi:MAG TPA: hypothetical protein VK577_03665 [Bradyrhizobium sp.]|nr:hypothetical protein [Bradyrhizobium sp.]
MDPLVMVLAGAAALLLLGIAEHPAFGVAGYALLILGGIWATS